MTIEKKSLISTLKTTKKANVAKDTFDAAPASVKLSTQKLGTQKLGTQKLGTQKLGTQKLGTRKT
jgi:hypothetical protein